MEVCLKSFRSGTNTERDLEEDGYYDEEEEEDGPQDIQINNQQLKISDARATKHQQPI